MAAYKLLMPKMGESVIEATILTWHKKVGDTVTEQEIILEVATDKVDSEVPCPVSGVVKQLLHDVDAVVGVGEPLAIIEVDGDVPEQFVPKKEKEETEVDEVESTSTPIVEEKKEEIKIKAEPEINQQQQAIQEVQHKVDVAQNESSFTPAFSSNKYYSPLVLSIAQAENISMQELEQITGTGADNRVTKEDILEYLKNRKSGNVNQKIQAQTEISKPEIVKKSTPIVEDIKAEIPIKSNTSSNVEIIEMDRMRKLIAQHMTNSRKTAAHVSSFVECDVTNIVKWRDKYKDSFKKREGFNLSFMPIFVDAITKAIKDYPMINISVDGDKIIRKKYINIGIATALPNGNLIVPVVRNTDQKSLLGIAKEMNNIVVKARNNALQPDDVLDGTYTISNIGTFGNIIGTPIINQPQVAIMAVGSITKKPVVIEVDGQDVIAIRHMLYLSHTYDHRVVDGQLGGLFVKKVADYLEKFDIGQEI
ncbi:MAG: dihydrolipoamide acetyltransferase family protein [Chitinophagales bacterium]